jgi:uncharacterized protein
LPGFSIWEIFHDPKLHPGEMTIQWTSYIIKTSNMNVSNDYTPQLIQPVIQPIPEKRVWGAWPTVGFTLVILAVFFVAQGIVVMFPVIGSLIDQMGAGVAQPDEIFELIMDELNAKLGLWQSIATIVSGIIGTALILVFIRARKGPGITEYLGLKKISIKAVLASIGITIAYLGLATLLETLLGVQNEETIINQIYDTSISPLLFWIAVIIFAPLFEEALFRGFMFEGLRRSWWGMYGAIMLTSFGWALLHGFQYPVGGIVYIFLLGIIMGIVRWKTNTIWSTFIMHAVVNLVATISLATGSNF